MVSLGYMLTGLFFGLRVGLISWFYWSMYALRWAAGLGAWNLNGMGFVAAFDFLSCSILVTKSFCSFLKFGTERARTGLKVNSMPVTLA